LELRSERIAKLFPRRQLEQRTAINATTKPVAGELLHELFEKQAQKTPQQIAVVSGDVRLTYSELTQMSRKLGRQLRKMGAKPNSLVAIVMEKGWEQIVAALSILQSGAAYVPIDSNLPPERLFQLLKNTEADLVLTQPGLNETLVWPPDIQKLSVVRMTDQAGLDGPLDPAQTADDLAYVIYTSGSTGLPKGVMIDHRGAVNTIVDLNERFGVSPRDKILALSSLSFDLSVYDVFGMLAAGATIVIPEASASRDPARWAELTQREAVTLWNSVPALMEMFVEYVSGRTEKLPSSLRVILLSGDWIPLTLPNQIKALADEIQLISLGGATEASIWSILYPIENVDPSWKSIPYGRPMINQSFHVLNDLLEPCPVWVSGQLYIGGIGLAKGYWRDLEKTAAKFIIHPGTGERLYQTGDLGRYFPDGNIEFLGREDFQVKIRGFRIELGEIEAAISLHPEVRSVVVTAIGKTTADRSLAAYVVLEREKAAVLPGENPAAGPAGSQLGFEARLKEFLAEKLPEHMIPSVIVLLDALPLTPNGKVDQRSLPKPDRVDLNPANDQATPRTEVEKVLAGIFQDILRISTVGIHDDFFALGGDSVTAIQLVSRANKKGYQLLPIMVFRQPTIAALAAKVNVQPKTDAAASTVDQARTEPVAPDPAAATSPEGLAEFGLDADDFASISKAVKKSADSA
jgi:amino acid adenylation domain-containing protein